jgi:uncharacterized membrane protein YgdD (TMEM256/DUF423 family)
MRKWLVVAGIYGAMAVGFAAWGAHGAGGPAAAWVERASLFQLIHAVALLALARWCGDRGWAAGLAAAGMTAGVALFSGSLYLKALGMPLPVPMVTPAGGVLLLLSWLLIPLISLRR